MQAASGHDRVLVRMKDTGKRVHRGGDVRRRKVIDAEGTEIGSVRALFFDPATQKVRYMEVVTQGIAGFARARTLVPVTFIIEITDDAVHIDENASASLEGAKYNPTLGDKSANHDSFGPLP